MTIPSADELAALRADALDPRRTQDLLESERACQAWERAHPTTLEGILEWIEQLRQLFGDPPVDRTPWKGDEFRI